MDLVDKAFEYFILSIKGILVTSIYIYIIIIFIKLCLFFKKIIFEFKEVTRLKNGIICSRDLFNLNDKDFGIWCLKFLENKRYHNVRIIEYSENHNISISCSKQKENYIIHCKKYCYGIIPKDMIDKYDIRNLLGEMSANDVFNGIIITSGKSSLFLKKYLKTIPKEYKIKIIDRDTLNRYCNIKKNRYILW